MSRQPGRLRQRPDRNFTTIRNNAMRDPTLSLKAKGLLVIMIGLPDKWVFRQTHLASLSTDGIDATRAALKELIEHGYLERKRARNEDGTLGGTDYWVTDEPINEEANTGFTYVGKSNIGKSNTIKKEGIKKEGIKKEKNKPSSSKDDALPQDFLSSAKEEHSSSMKTKISAAKSSRFLEDLKDAWNTNRGKLPKAMTLSSKRARALERFVRECGKADLDPVRVLTVATRVVAKDDFWVKGKYGLDNLLAGDKVFARYEAAPDVGVQVEFMAGDRVSWLMNPNLPFGKLEFGTVVEVQAAREGTVVSVMRDQDERVVTKFPESLALIEDE